MKIALLQNELNSDVACFTTHFRTCLATNKVARFVFVGSKKAQHRYSTRFAAMLQNKLFARFYCPFSRTLIRLTITYKFRGGFVLV